MNFHLQEFLQDFNALFILKILLCVVDFFLGIFSAFAVIFIISTFASHAYDFLNRKEWDESLKEYIV